MPSSGYADYRSLMHQRYREDVAPAARAGLVLRPEAELDAALLTEAEWRRRHAYEGFVCERILYRSDGLDVEGYIWRPDDATPRRRPAILFNRGGLGPSPRTGALTPDLQLGFLRFVQAGYVVLGTQYRGNGGSPVPEQPYDGDERDVRNLARLARGLDVVDPDNLFMMGISRGGAVAMLALRSGLWVNAVATVSAPFDLVAGVGSGYRNPATRGAPDVRPADPASVARSAVQWPEAISAPLLMLQGGGDGRTPAGPNALAMAQRLQALAKPFEVVVYDGDTHLLLFNAEDRDDRILAWFARHRR